VLVVFEKGNIVRSRVDEVRLTGRNTMGVQFAKPGKNDAIVAVTRNPEKEVEEAVEEAIEAAEGPADGAEGAVEGSAATPESDGAGVADATADAVPSSEEPDESDRGGRE